MVLGCDWGEHSTGRWALPQRRVIDSNFTVPQETRAWDDGEHHWGGNCGLWEAEEVNMHSIYFCLHASEGQKSMKGATIERQKNPKKSNRNIKNRDAPTLKLETNGLEVFVNTPWASFCAMDVSSNIKLRLLLMHKYCNQLVTRFSRFLTDTQFTVSQ